MSKTTLQLITLPCPETRAWGVVDY